MIINLVGSVNPDGVIDFDLPCIYFSSCQSVTVKEIFICHHKSVREVHGYLSTTLIDKSPLNPRQQLLFFYQPEKSKFFYYSPTQFVSYKIQTQSLSSSVFQFHLSEEDKKYNFARHKREKVYLQLEIKTNAGILGDHSQSL